MADLVECVQTGAIRTITLNRPDKANSLNKAMLIDLLRLVTDTRPARALILTARGRVFSAGADLEEVKNAALATSGLWEELSAAIAGFDGLSIAALNGTIAGGAMGMALACDLRIAVAEADIFYPVMKRGVLPQPSDPGRLKALIGPARSRLILMAGQKISAAEAQDFGLIDRIVERDALLDTARDLARDIATAPDEIARAITDLCR